MPSISRSTGACARSRTRRSTVAWVRRYSHLGEHGAVWLVGGAAAALVDRRRRRRWLRATAAVGAAYATSTSIKLAVGRKRPAIEDLPHLMATPTGLSFPSLALDLVVRRRARVRRARPRRAAAGRGAAMGLSPPLPRRPLPVRRRRRRRARHR